MSQIIQLRGGTTVEGSASNPILAIREMAIETDSGKFKVGDGVSHWNDLPYGGVIGPQGASGNTGASGSTILPEPLSLEFSWSMNNPDFFTKFTYVGSIVSKIDIWTDMSMTTKLFSKVFTYSLGLITSIVTTKISTGGVLTKTITYSSGKVDTITHTQT